MAVLKLKSNTNWLKEKLSKNIYALSDALTPRRLLLLVAIISVLLCLATWSAINSLRLSPDPEEALAASLEQTTFTQPLPDREFESTLSPEPLTLLQMQANLSSFVSANSATAFGGYTLAFDDREALLAAVSSIEEQGYRVSFVMMDIVTGYGVSYNSDMEFYSASSIKAFYVASVAASLPESIYSWSSSMRAAIEDSSNDDYFALRYAYGDDPLVTWFEDAGVDSSLAYEWWPYYSARTLAKLWLRNYDYFESGSEGVDQVREWYSSTYNSTIYDNLGPFYSVLTKSGWIADEELSASVDAGIIYANDKPYLMVIMTDVPDDVPSLASLVTSLDQVHENMQFS